MKRIMFVDGDQEVLEGLQRVLREQRKSWELVFVSSAPAATAALRGQEFDVVVTDMSMPEVDGAEFLASLSNEHPSVARLVLSGSSNRRAIAKTFPLAQDFLPKPCAPQELVRVIGRALQIQSIVANEAMLDAVGGVDSLPSPPAIYAQLSETLNREDVNARKVAGVVAQDPAVSTKVLRLANSGLFSPRRPLTTIQAAVSMIGADAIRDLVLATTAHDASRGGVRIPGSSVDAEQAHSFQVADLAKRLLDEQSAAAEAFVGGLLHDIGKLVLATRRPREYRSAQVLALAAGLPLVEAEKTAFGFSHADVGALLLDLWGVPRAIVSVVAGHHAPERLGKGELDATTAVHIANGLTRASELGVKLTDCLEPGLIERTGVAKRIEELTGFAPALDAAG